MIADGVVAIDTEWAVRNNFAPSTPHPEDPTKSIYQIDMFHSIHCVVGFKDLRKLACLSHFVTIVSDQESSHIESFTTSMATK